MDQKLICYSGNVTYGLFGSMHNVTYFRLTLQFFFCTTEATRMLGKQIYLHVPVNELLILSVYSAADRFSKLWQQTHDLRLFFTVIGKLIHMIHALQFCCLFDFVATVVHNHSAAPQMTHNKLICNPRTFHKGLKLLIAFGKKVREAYS